MAKRPPLKSLQWESPADDLPEALPEDPGPGTYDVTVRIIAGPVELWRDVVRVEAATHRANANARAGTRVLREQAHLLTPGRATQVLESTRILEDAHVALHEA